MGYAFYAPLRDLKNLTHATLTKYSSNPNIQAQLCAASFISLYAPSLAYSKGDSGGPVYSLTGKAYGIVSTASFSGKGIGQCHRLTFTLIDYAVRNLGFSVQTES